MKIKAILCVSRGSDNRFNLTIMDEASRVQFVDLDLSPEQFAMAITAHVTTGIVGDVRGLDKVGMRHEVKVEDVPFEKLYAHKDERAMLAESALAPFETNGWIGRDSDLFNGHKTVSPGIQRVTFERHVPINSAQEPKP